MPIISFYGGKGGTGRTTSAAALARGMVARGMQVVLVESFDTPRAPLSRWVAEFDPIALRFGGRLMYRRCLTPRDVDQLLEFAASDNDHAVIFDTSVAVSAVRAYAFELADVIVMPFTGYLDAEVGVAKASMLLGRNAVLKGLPVRAPAHIVDQVAEWMPVLDSALPDDERLILGSTASHGLDAETAAAEFDGYEQMRSLPDLLVTLAEDVMAEQRGAPPAPAVLHPHASLDAVA